MRGSWMGPHSPEVESGLLLVLLGPRALAPKPFGNSGASGFIVAGWRWVGAPPNECPMSASLNSGKLKKPKVLICLIRIRPVKTVPAPLRRAPPRRLAW